MVSPPDGHERKEGTETDKLDWNNQLVVVAECTGSTKSRHCDWRKTGSVWTHISAAPPVHPFPRN